jgi:predicted transcriptional regulator
MKELTKAEEQIMQILWKIKKGFVNDIIAEMSKPKPAYNTVSTIVRILETKEFVSHNAYGKTHEYFPLISKDEYTNGSLNKLVSDYFGNSYHDLVSFFTRRDNISVNELEQIKNLIDQELKNKKI